jgi:hypothetical protein
VFFRGTNVPVPLDNADQAPMNVQLVNHANSPFAAQAGQTLRIDASAGNVTINLPVLAVGQFVAWEQDSATSLAGHTITFNGPAAVNVDQPPPSNGTFVAALVIGNGTNWTDPTARGMSGTFVNLGSAGGYSLL